MACLRIGKILPSIHWCCPLPCWAVQEAIDRLDEGIKFRNATEAHSWVFLAMAHHRLGHRDDARRYLDRLRNRRPSTDPNEFWNELEIRLLRSEAEAVILYDPVFPADPFAH